MKKFVGAAMLAGAALAGTAGVANAETSVSGNVAFTTDYVWRGLSQNDNDFAVQGGADLTSGIFYAGTWASSLASGAELDGYFGVRPTLGPVAFDIGYVGYFYPSANEGDFHELKVGASVSPVEGLTLGVTTFYSPDFGTFSESGFYYEGSASFAATDALSFAATWGEQSVDSEVGSYSNWSVGGTYSAVGFGFNLKYTDTSGADGFDLGPGTADEKFIFTVSRAL